MTKLNLEELRENIDKTDRKLLEILVERFALTQKVGEYKKEHSLKALAQNREEQVFEAREKWAVELDLEPALIKQIFTLVIEEVKKKHKEISNNN